MGAMKGLLNMDNVRIVLIPFGISGSGSAQSRRTSFAVHLGDDIEGLYMDNESIGAFQSITIDGKLYSLSYEARDWFNGVTLCDAKGRVLVPVGVIVDFQSRYIMLAL